MRNILIISFWILLGCATQKSFDLNERINELTDSKIKSEQTKSSFKTDEIRTIEKRTYDDGLQVWKSHVESSFGEETYTYYLNAKNELLLSDVSVLKRLCDENKNNCLARKRTFFDESATVYCDHGEMKMTKIPTTDDWGKLVLSQTITEGDIEKVKSEVSDVINAYENMSSNKLMEGMYFYFADAASFTPCDGKNAIPVAFEEDHINLESAYLKMDLEEMDQVFVRLIGRIEDRPAMEGNKIVPKLIVLKAISAYVNQSCK